MPLILGVERHDVTWNQACISPWWFRPRVSARGGHFSLDSGTVHFAWACSWCSSSTNKNVGTRGNENSHHTCHPTMWAGLTNLQLRGIRHKRIHTTVQPHLQGVQNPAARSQGTGCLWYGCLRGLCSFPRVGDRPIGSSRQGFEALPPDPSV